MAYLIGVLLAIALLVALVRKGMKRGTATDGNLKNTVPGATKEPPAPTGTGSRVKDTTPAGASAKRASTVAAEGGGPHQQPLDVSYAHTNNLWVCPHCETLNESAMSTCQACGTHK